MQRSSTTTTPTHNKQTNHNTHLMPIQPTHAAPPHTHSIRFESTIDRDTYAVPQYRCSPDRSITIHAQPCAYTIHPTYIRKQFINDPAAK